MKEQYVTLTIPVDVYDRIFEIMGTRHKGDPDTDHILSVLYAAYLASTSNGDNLSPLAQKLSDVAKVNSLAKTILFMQKQQQ